MASTTSLLSGLSGLNANSRKLEIIGNNVANINTTAYKANRVMFAPALSRSFSLGTTPSNASGGTNPGQIGLGVNVAGTQRSFADGAISPTGVSTDLAIEGDGFFIVEGAGQQYYTRSGAFQLNSTRDLVTITGERVRGFGVDEDFRVVEGSLIDLNIPLGSMTLAEQTENVFLSGNLNADVNLLPTQGATITYDQIFNNLGTAMPFQTGMGELLVDNLEDPNNIGMPLFPNANMPYTYTISGAMKGTSVVPDASLTIDGTTTIDDFLEFINDTFGIIDGLMNPDGSTTGAQIDGAGNLSIVGNTGDSNNITFTEAEVSIVDMASAAVANPFTLSQDPITGIADGESVRTTFIIYDSLGTPLEVNMTMVFESASNAGTSWRYYLDSPDNIDLMDPDLNIGSGTVTFDTVGGLTSNVPILEVISRDNTGADAPMSFALNFEGANDSVTALVDEDTANGSVLSAIFQDGTGIGTLSTFSVGGDGVITGAFTNGLTRVVGQVAVARFTNSEGLVDAGNSMFRTGPNSGTALVTTPQSFGTGRVIGGALELSNVDLGSQFTDMILTTTGYSAASRVITTTDELLQQLVALGR